LSTDSPMKHLLCLYQISDAYAMKTAEKGIIEIEPNKNYPLSLMIEN